MVGKRLFGQPVQRARIRIALELTVPLRCIERREPGAQLFEFRRRKLGDLLLKAFKAGHAGFFSTGGRFRCGRVLGKLAWTRASRAMAAYIALVQKDEGTSFGVSFPDVPGCVSAGDTLDEALANAAEALGGHLSIMRMDGEAEPEARSLEAIGADPEYCEDLSDALVRIVAPGMGTEVRLVRVPQHSGATRDVWEPDPTVSVSGTLQEHER